MEAESQMNNVIDQYTPKLYGKFEFMEEAEHISSEAKLSFLSKLEALLEEYKVKELNMGLLS